MKTSIRTGINIGLSEKDRKKIADDLSCLLADTYTLYLKTHNYHWNVTGPLFPTLHKLFEEQYQQLANAVDELAERIRALGHPAPATFHEFLKLATIPEDQSVPDACDMIRQLVEGHEACVRTARQSLSVIEESDDQPTLDLLAKRMEEHEKNAWMLRSSLEPSRTRGGAAAA